jgi:hypothetical protein
VLAGKDLRRGERPPADSYRRTTRPARIKFAARIRLDRRERADPCETGGLVKPACERKVPVSKHLELIRGGAQQFAKVL